MARYSEAQKKAVAKYQKKVYDDIRFRVPKGFKDDILKPAADRVGESVNAYVKKAVEQRIEREEAAEG